MKLGRKSKGVGEDVWQGREREGKKRSEGGERKREREGGGYMKEEEGRK